MAFYVDLESLKQKEMKKVKIFLLLVVSLFVVVGCDPPRYYDYFITNKCNETIEVKISSDWEGAYGRVETFNFLIEPDTTYFITSFEDYQPLNANMVEVFFKEILITKENKTSKVNYVDKSLWVFKPTSKDHTNSYLTVYPDDFEND